MMEPAYQDGQRVGFSSIYGLLLANGFSCSAGDGVPLRT